MFNYIVEYPNEILDKKTLKSFFAITRKGRWHLDMNTWLWTDSLLLVSPASGCGQWILPELNWRKYGEDGIRRTRSSLHQGNTGTVNSFIDIDLGDITWGAYHTADLKNLAKFVCYFYQLTLTLDARLSEELRARIGLGRTVDVCAEPNRALCWLAVCQDW